MRTGQEEIPMTTLINVLHVGGATAHGLNSISCSQISGQLGYGAQWMVSEPRDTCTCRSLSFAH